MRHLVMIASIIIPTAAAAETPPPAPRRPVTTEYQGVVIDDPYRNLEKLDDPDVRRWLDAQASYTRRTLDRIPGLAKLKARVEALDHMVEVHLTSPQRKPGGHIFYLKRKPAEPLPKLYLQTGDGKEKLLFAPDEALARGGKREALNNFAPSPDGRLVALVSAPVDSEVGAMRLREVKSGRDLGAAIPSIWGELAAVWHPDGQRFYYTKSASTDRTKPFEKQQIIVRALDGGADRPVFGWQAAGAPASRETDWPFLLMSAGSPYVVGVLQEGVNSPLRLYVAPRDKLGTAAPEWRALVDEKDGVRSLAPVDRWLYLRTFVGAPRYRVLRYDLSTPQNAPVEVVSQQRGVIDQIAPAADGLYYVVRDNAIGELYFLAHNTKEPRKLALPYAGAVEIADADPDQPGVLFFLSAWTRDRQLFRGDANGVANTGLVPPGPFGAGDDLFAEETTCAAADGVRVPVSIIGKKGLPRDGSNPLLLNGYGGYGFTETAHLEPTWRAWYERGGLIAVVNPRGSGAYGEEWYRAGQGKTKPNTWKDMIACAQALIERKYTSAKKLGIVGTSMGGVAVGRSVTERPDLFAVAFLRVGIFDAIRFIEATPNGPNHEREMGSLSSPAEVRQLLEMSSYHHVQPGARYPAILVSQGLNDNRVAPWISIKMAALLQSATSSGLPILLRTETEGGHGVTSTAQQINAEWADSMAFHLWNVGDPAFQPR